MDPVPFAPKDQLCHKLHTTSDQTSIQRLPKHPQVGSALGESLRTKSHLPGQPWVELEDANIGTYLESELVTKDLDKLALQLWPIAKQDSSHISSLTHQIVRSRDITITEKPELHLVWIHNRIFIKPIPNTCYHMPSGISTSLIDTCQYRRKSEGTSQGTSQGLPWGS